MCAIAGVLETAVNETVTERMLSTMVHRGPDGKGVYQGEDCTLLHSRLAIIDPEGGCQPMELDWGGEQYILVYNGELYNTAQLREELTREKHVFTGHSDTEVVLHAYVQWGEHALEKMNGIFAFAIWEERKKRLFLARDRIGVKPLYYSDRGRAFLFASEMKTILAFPGIPAQLDEEGAVQLIMLGPGKLPGSGVFRGIRELEPGWCGCWQNGQFSVKQYWKLRDRVHGESFEETAECVGYLVRDAIQRQMVSDVPIGTFLSGGLDSSIISAVCAEEFRKQGRSLKTFSVDYLNNDLYFQPGKFQPDSDNGYIALMQKALASEHKWTVLTPGDLLDCLEDATRARDLPGMADVDFSLLAFCRDIRRQVKVALSGECADEIFGGYPWYRDPEVRAMAGFPWAQNTADRASLLTEAVSVRINPAGYVADAYESTCLQSDILPENSPLEKRTKEMVNLNFRWFMQTLLARKDHMSMACGLEVRVPFCDYRIAEYLYAVPWEYKDYRGREKGLLRYAVTGLLPEKILTRKKSPYPKTFDPEYERRLSERMESLMARSNAPVFHLIRREELQRLLEAKSPWPWYGQLMRRPQIMAYFLQLDYWLQQYDVDMMF